MGRLLEPHRSPVVRVPIDAVTSGASYFTPGITVDPTTSGAGARIGLYYNSYPDAACAVATCRIDVGYISSTDGGSTWSAPRTVAGPFPISWLAQAGGAFVGDYNAAAVVHGRAVSVFAVAHAPAGNTLNEPMATAGPLAITGGRRPPDTTASDATDHSQPPVVAGRGEGPATRR